MKFSIVAVLATATGALAYRGDNVTYTTEVVTALTTYCPYATTISNNGQTITVTEATTVTFTNCPCTISKAVTTYSSVICNACNSTASHTKSASASSSPSPVVTAGAGKAAALSGAGLAGVLGLAALAL